MIADNIMTLQFTTRQFLLHIIIHVPGIVLNERGQRQFLTLLLTTNIYLLFM